MILDHLGTILYMFSNFTSFLNKCIIPGVCACMYVSVFVFISFCIYVCICMGVYAQVHLKCLDICEGVFVCVCVCVCVVCVCVCGVSVCQGL